jgi:hypothetical protein
LEADTTAAGPSAAVLALSVFLELVDRREHEGDLLGLRLQLAQQLGGAALPHNLHQRLVDKKRVHGFKNLFGLVARAAIRRRGAHGAAGQRAAARATWRDGLARGAPV